MNGRTYHPQEEQPEYCRDDKGCLCSKCKCVDGKMQMSGCEDCGKGESSFNSFLERCLDDLVCSLQAASPTASSSSTARRTLSASTRLSNNEWSMWNSSL